MHHVVRRGRQLFDLSGIFELGLDDVLAAFDFIDDGFVAVARQASVD